MVTDPSGLKWTIMRQGDRLAECCPDKNAGDDINTLAAQIGLDTENSGKWLTQKDGKYFVPNTIFAIWAGDDVLTFTTPTGEKAKVSLGKQVVGWNGSVKYLEKLGFNVQNQDRPQGFVSLIGAASQDKSLHGLYFWGHGAPELIANKDATWTASYSDIVGQLQYKMAFVVLNACFSDHKKGDANIKFWFPNKPFTIQTFAGPLKAGGRDLISPSAAKLFYGSPGILAPYQEIPFIRKLLGPQTFGAYPYKKPEQILKPGDQGTKS